MNEMTQFQPVWLCQLRIPSMEPPKVLIGKCEEGIVQVSKGTYPKASAKGRYSTILVSAIQCCSLPSSSSYLSSSYLSVSISSFVFRRHFQHSIPLQFPFKSVSFNQTTIPFHFQLNSPNSSQHRHCFPFSFFPHSPVIHCMMGSYMLTCAFQKSIDNKDCTYIPSVNFPLPSFQSCIFLYISIAKSAQESRCLSIAHPRSFAVTMAQSANPFHCPHHLAVL